MDNPGTYTLCAQQITVANPLLMLTPIDDLDGMTAVTLEAVFAYGSGGTSCSAVVQTTFDEGATWRDVARFDFTTASQALVANLSGLLSKAVGAYAALGSQGVNDGMLGDQLRASVTSAGTYAGTNLTVRASVR